MPERLWEGKNDGTIKEEISCIYNGEPIRERGNYLVWTYVIADGLRCHPACDH